MSGLADRVSEKLHSLPVVFAFLEIQEPDIETAFSDLVLNKGCRTVVFLMHFLNSGRHVLSDIPDKVDGLRKKYPDIRIQISELIGSHSLLPELYADIAESCRSSNV
ncbi:MAG: CbiX/SirB N-terminal domain-containing protein [Candidatus Omnitrophica bacterium]|nr:CbiX/SirB N-terminal domain-containing protein [Candidatus Omnitrophota bacterium]